LIYICTYKDTFAFVASTVSSPAFGSLNLAGEEQVFLGANDGQMPSEQAGYWLQYGFP
jgi:hypothetical protein